MCVCVCNLTEVQQTLCCSPAHSTTLGPTNLLLLPDPGTHSCLRAFAHALPTAWTLRRPTLPLVFAQRSPFQWGQLEHLASHSTPASHQNVLCFIYVAFVTL